MPPRLQSQVGSRPGPRARHIVGNCSVGCDTELDSGHFTLEGLQGKKFEARFMGFQELTLSSNLMLMSYKLQR